MSRGKHPIYTRGTSLVQGGENWTGERKFVFFAFKANICLGNFLGANTSPLRNISPPMQMDRSCPDSEQIAPKGAASYGISLGAAGGANTSLLKGAGGAGYIYLYIYPLLVYHKTAPSVKSFCKKIREFSMLKRLFLCG